LPSKEEDFKRRFAGILLDLATSDDADAQAMLGGLAVRIVKAAGWPSWTTFKQNLTREDYDGLLRTFQVQGNGLAQQGQHRQVHAIEVLATALVAKTQMQDADVAAEAPRLDQFIDDAITAYRDAQSADPIIS
jgi:hypothetical protein